MRRILETCIELQKGAIRQLDAFLADDEGLT